MGLLVAGTKYEVNSKNVLKKLWTKSDKQETWYYLLSMKCTLIGAGAAEGAIDAANILKPAFLVEKSK